MADVRLIKSGNASDPTTYNTGTLPTSLDDLWLNTFTLNADISLTVLSIRNGSTTNVTAGGTLNIQNGVTLTATAANGFVNLFYASGNYLISTANLVAGQSATLVGNVISSNGGNGSGPLLHSGAGTLNVVGNILGSIGNNSSPSVLSGAGVLNITGIVYGGTTNPASTGLHVTGTGTVNVTGSAIGPAGPGILLSGLGTVNHVGAVLAGSSPGISQTSAGTLIVNGTLTASNSSAAVTATNVNGLTVLSGPFIVASNGVHAVYAVNWKWLNTNPPPTYYQIRSANNAVVRPLYTADSVGGNPVASNVRSGIVYGPNSELTGTCAVPPAESVGVGVPVDATTGTAAVTATALRAALGTAGNLDAQLAAIPTTAAPTASTVAQAVWAAETRTLTTTIPSASQIASAIWAAADKVGYSLTEAERTAISTAVQAGILNESDGQQILNAIVGAIGNQNVDQIALVAAIRSDLERTGGTLATRLAASAYSAPPNAAQNATAVRTELAPELARLDVAVGTRLAPNDTLARVSLADTVTTLTNAPDMPTAEEIAAEVWVTDDRTVTGGTVDTVANATPVDASQVATAVRTELSTELARVSNAATTQEVADIVEGAMQSPVQP